MSILLSEERFGLKGGQTLHNSKCRWLWVLCSCSLLTDACASNSAMTDIKKEIKNAGQDLEAKAQTAKDHMEGKPSSETLNKANVKADDVVEDVKRDV